MKDWAEITLGECFEFVKTKADPRTLPDDTPYVGMEHLIPEQSTIPATATAKGISSTVQWFESGDILYGKLRPYLRKVAIAEVSGVSSTEILALRPNDRVDPRFLYYLVASDAVAEHAVRVSSGSRMPRVSPSDLSRIEVLLPPKSEQRRIADLLGRLDRQCAALEGEALAIRVVLNATRAELPVADEVEIRDCLLGIDSGRSVQTTGLAPSDGQPRILKLSAVRPGSFDPSEAKRLTDLSGFTADHLVRDGDVLITRSNTPDRVGYAAMAYEVPAKTYMPDLMWRLRPNPRCCTPEYLQHVLSAPQIRDRVTSTASGTSASMRKINKAGFGVVRIPLPDIKEQEVYAGRCDDLALVERLLMRERESVRALRSELSTALLGQSLTLPSTYDRVLGQVA